MFFCDLQVSTLRHISLRSNTIVAVGFNLQLWPSDVEQWPSGQTKRAKPAQGRANSELRNVAPQGEAAAEAPKKQKGLQIRKLGDLKQNLNHNIDHAFGHDNHLADILTFYPFLNLF